MQMKVAGAVVFIGITLLAGAVALSQESSITIEFTQVPPRGAGPETQGNIAGRVHGLDNPSNYKVVLFAHTDKWYVQPLVSNPYTDINAEGEWTNWTHLGYRYAALVVDPSFKPPAKIDALPKEGGKVIAKAETPARE